MITREHMPDQRWMAHFLAGVSVTPGIWRVAMLGCMGD